MIRSWSHQLLIIYILTIYQKLVKIGVRCKNADGLCGNGIVTGNCLIALWLYVGGKGGGGRFGLVP